ncbi:MAG: GNAT family N-acetyltransferase [Paracoccaceae bacterium]
MIPTAAPVRLRGLLPKTKGGEGDTSYDIEWLVEQHDRLYARDEGFDASFAILVREILTDFVANFDPKTEAAFIACTPEGQRLGCVFCQHKSPSTAKLRLFLVVPEARGLGLGAQLLQACMRFAKDAGYGGMELWTHETHHAACALYQAHGWQMVRSEPKRSFGTDVVEQSWQISFC